MSEESLKADCDPIARGPLLLRSHRIQAVVEIDGPISRQHLLHIRFQGAFALTDLLGAALLGLLTIFGSNLAGIDESLGSGRRHGKQRDGCDDNDLFQMSLRKSAHPSAWFRKAQMAIVMGPISKPSPDRPNRWGRWLDDINVPGEIRHFGAWSILCPKWPVS